MSLLSNDEINLLNSDSKYRNYVSSIEKALKNFESSTEWADLIASLNKLKKVLSSTPKYQFIPKRVSVCKRLAQCLHPALPSGVHLKALEVYTVLFQNIGPENLSRDLFIYSSGLFPLLANAALSVKPVLINIYETYFLPLKKALRPCLTGLILGILPGLEEGSDFYARTFNLLKNICIAQSDSNISTRTNGSRDSFESTSSIQIADEKYFYTCLWSAIVAQSSVRFPAIQFILTNFETKKKSNLATPSQAANEDQLYLIGNSIDLMVNGICCCLQDTNPLVQRSILDFICLCLPISTTQITKSDKLQLIVVAIHVVLRRDMSLNRRIYSWLMGSSNNKPVQGTKINKTNDSSSQQTKKEDYFDMYSKSLLISSIKMLLNNKKDQTILYLFNEEQQNFTTAPASHPNQNSNSSNGNNSLINPTNTNTTLRILKIVSNLVERQDIGQSIIDEILLDLLFYVYKESCSLNIYSQGNNYSVNQNGHKRTHSNLMVSNTQSTSNSSQFKELNELKKASYNFLFESFQRYFIWEFCANKFEMICKNYTEISTGSTNNITVITPGQLCDLYEFILDLLKTNEMYAEILSEYLPLMLKRIIKTINTYCSKMTNLDLSKSILLCSKILKKVVPEIVIADQRKFSTNSGKHQRNRSDTKNYHTNKTSEPSLPIENLDENSQVISDLLNSLISQIEAQSDEPVNIPVNDQKIETNIKNENNDFIIESCVFYLKQLCHTFIRSHLIQSADNNDKIKKSFQSLFNQKGSNNSVNNYMEITCLNCPKNDEQKDEETTSVNLIQLKPECLNYLHSFQILNKFLIKMLFFPREKAQDDEKKTKSIDSSNEQDDQNECCRQARREKINKLLIDSFDEWVKDIFVISCCSTMTNNSKQISAYSSKLFEFQSITINTIIELIHLSESVNAHFPNSKSGSRKSSISVESNGNSLINTTSNNNTCLVQTVFTNKQINLIYNHSDFGILIAKMLWSHLSNDSFISNGNNNNNQLNLNAITNSNSNFNGPISHHQFLALNKQDSTTDKRASILFCLLHETLPNNLCEDIIAQNLLPNTTLSQNNSFDLTNDYLTLQMDSLKRFIRLWHWSREINSQHLNQSAGNNGQNDDLDDISDYMSDFISLNTTLTFKRSTKTFERSLLIILDMLNEKSTPSSVVKLVQEWLVTLICEYNDLPRLLDILLVSLLHPSTARISIQNFISNLITNSFTTTNLQVNSACDPNEPENDYEAKVYAISNEGGNVKYHVNEISSNKKTTNNQQQLFLMTSIASAEINQSSSSLPSLTNSSSLNNSLTNGSTSKTVKNPNVELPLSILNAASLANLANQGISLRINPLKGDTSEVFNNTEDFANEFTEQTDNQENNAKFLEKYKAIKAGQLKQEKDKLNISISTSNSNASSPSHGNKIFPHLKNDTETNEANSFCNEEDAGRTEEEDIVNQEQEENEFEDYFNHDEDDDEDDEEDDEDSQYNSNCNFNTDENFYDDNQSQSTDITILKDDNGDLISNNYSSGTNQTDSLKMSKFDEKKLKRKSDLILPVNKISTQTSKDSQKKSLSLTGRYKSKSNKSKENSPKSKLTTNPLNNSQLTLKEKSATIGSRHPIKSNNSPCRNLLKTLNNSNARELTIDALNPIDPNYSYMLIYSNCNNMQTSQQSHSVNNKISVASSTTGSFDHTRTLFILRCLEQLLIKCPKEFLTSVTRTYVTANTNLNYNSKSQNPNQLNSVLNSNQSGFSVHNEKLLDLIVRHLKSVYGNSFFSEASPTNSFDLNKLNFNLSNVTYIEAITIILLFYIRSYYPPSEFSLINEKLGFNNNKTVLSNSISTTSLNTSSSGGSSVLSQCSSNNESLKSANTSTLSQSSPHLLINPQINNYNQIAEQFSEKRLDYDERLFNENRNVQIYSLQILSKMIKELSSLCKYSNSLTSTSFQRSSSQIGFCNGFLLSANNQASYQPIIDLLDKCKLQKTLLLCFYSTINTANMNTLAQCILSNSKYIKETNVRDEILHRRKQIQYAYMSELMDALENLIQLEKVLNDFQMISKINRSGTTPTNPPLNATNHNSSRNGLVNENQQQSATEDDFLLTVNKKLSNSNGSSANQPNNKTTSNVPNSSSASSTRYIPIQSICNQSMFISSVLHYLRNITLVDYHLPILKLVRNSLPSAGNALKTLSTFVIEQLCRNLLQITNSNISGGSSSSNSSYLIPSIAYMSSISSAINIPDLIVSILKQLSYLLHYCLLSTPNVLGSNDLITGSLITSLFQIPNLSDAQLKMFRQYQAENDTCLNQAKDSLLNLLPSIMSSMTQVWQRCNLLLNSNGLHGVNILFESISQQHQQQHQYQYSWILGHPIIIKQAITDMLSPVVQFHGTAFMIAIGQVWGEKRKRSRLNQEHKVIIEIIKSLKICSIPVILQNITEILKQSNANNNKDKKKSPINVWLLQFLHSYLESYSISIKKKTSDSYDTLGPTINALCNFFKECLSSSVASNLIAACYFQLFRILHDSVNNFSELVDDKKYSKEIQESTHKLFEICNSIVASSLQQTTWLRKNFAVKLVPQISVQPTLQPNQSIPTNLSNSINSLNSVQSALTNTGASNNLSLGNSAIVGLDNTIQSTYSMVDANSSGYGGSQSMISTNSIISDPKFRQNKSGDSQVASLSDLENEIGANNSDATSNLNCIDHLNSNGDSNDTNNLNQSLQALNILAEYLAKTLDIVYKSDEKDRLVIPLLTSLMFNLWPYLKTHSIANKNNFRAASHLLMSLAVHPYTRKTWKKEVFEMLFDNLYFHVDSATLDDWKIIIDHLINTNSDRQMFKDVLVRVQYQQSSGLFTSKEQESEQKAQLLKRLAFVIYSSEKDQYQKNMPEIQECIAHILKLVQSPNLYSTLFLLFRILLLRISGRHLIALWPTILTELIIILLQMEQDLTDEIESKNNTKQIYLDHIANTNSTLQQSTSTKLQIYLSACKLIDLILTLPSSVTTQFQMCKWSFINTADVLDLKQKDQFVPYLIKINNLLKTKFPITKTPMFRLTGGPLIRQRQIQSIVELKPFFEIVNTYAFVHNSNQAHINQQNSNYLRQFETTVHEDFLDGWLQ